MISAATQNPPPPRAQPPKSRRFKFFRVTSALIMREIASTDSRVSLGFLWQLIEPVASVALLTIIFQMFTRVPPLGTNYPLFYITGLMPFQMFLIVGNKVSGTVRFSRPLLEFPAVNVIDALAARFILNFLIQCAVFVLLTSGCIWLYQLQVVVDIPLAAKSLFLAAFLGLGLGTFNSVLFLAFPTYETIWGVVTRPLMLLSGVLFLVNELPNPFRTWIYWNPLVHVVSLMRAAFYPGANIDHVSPLYLVLISLVSLCLGLVTLKRFFRDALER